MPQRIGSAIRAVLVLACLAIIAFPQQATAHAIVEETQPGIGETVPESPERVLISFNEPVEVAFGAIRVFDTDGERVDVGEADHVEGHADEVQVALRPDLPKGTYTVAWRVVSADGHAISEAFVFHVKEPGVVQPDLSEEFFGETGAIVSALFGVVRWANFASLIVLVGGGFFVMWIWRGRAIDAAIDARFAGRWRSIARGAWITAALATIAGIVLQGAVAGGYSLAEAFSPSIVSEVLSTRYGKVAIVKLLLLVSIAAWWILMGSKTPRTQSLGAAGTARRPSVVAAIVGGVLALGLLATPGLAGHAGTTSPIGLNVAADTAHVGAAALWMGGLAILIAGAFHAVRSVDDAGRTTLLGPVISSFSDVAVVAIVLLVVTGTYRSWVEVGAWRALIAAPYGWILLSKIGVFIPALALGVVNNRMMKPRIEKAAAAGEPTQALSKLRKFVGVEVALGAVVLALTAVLVSLAPARTEAGVSGPFTTQVAIGEDSLDVIVTPNRIGENEVHLTVTTPEGAPSEIKGMSVLFRKPDQGIGPIISQGNELATGHFVVQGNELSVPGNWELEVVARLNRFDEERATFEVNVNR